MASANIPNPSSWLAILNKLGIPRFGQWSLLDTVQPVALVDSEVSLSAVASTALLGTPASAGELVAPAANTRLADTGALAAGSWSFAIVMSANDSNTMRVRRRNAADAGDIWSFRVPFASSTGIMTFVFPLFRSTIGVNERLVVENVAAGGAGTTYQASIFATQG